jgi:hypothetical protein
MRKKYFSRKIQRRAKNNLKRNGGRKKMLSKRFGGMLHASAIVENRNQNAAA